MDDFSAIENGSIDLDFVDKVPSKSHHIPKEVFQPSEKSQLTQNEDSNKYL
jgi:hypothetical protein